MKTWPTPETWAIFCGQDGVGFVVHLRHRHRVGGEAKHDDGRIGRDWSCGSWGSEGRFVGQLGTGGVDGGLHVAGGAVDVAIEVELHVDAGRAQGGARGHLGDAGDAAELALERGGDGGGHGLGVGAGKATRPR